MSMNLLYTSGFHSLNGTTYEVRIYRKDYSGEPSEIALSAEDPLTIEWKESDKLDPVASSSATLRLYSDSDRQFVDLYTIEAGSVRMDVIRDGSLYWSGTLDTELYEEPYAYKTDYIVSLTFSDFAILDRINYDLSGFLTMRELLTNAIGKSCISYSGMTEYISTALFQGSSDNLLDILSVLSDNYYDEDGEPMTWREVLESALQPLALSIRQKGGFLFLYDLNALSTAFNPEETVWNSDDSSMECDKVYNDILLKFSPYEETTLLHADVQEDSVEGSEHTVWIGTEAQSGEVGFTFILSDTGKGVEKSSSAKYFRINSVYSGDDCAGIAWTARTFTAMNGGNYVTYGNAPCANQSSMLFKTGKAYVGITDRSNYRINIQLSLLFDTRYNPFEEACKSNEEGDYDRLKNWANFVYVPIKVLLKDDSGNVIYHYQNSGVKNSTSFSHGSAGWRAGDATWEDCWLCWYAGNRKNETGVGGWSTNKQIIGYYRGEKLPVLFDKMGQGDYLELPTTAGWIEVYIGTGVECYDYESGSSWQLRDDIYDITRWVMYRDLKVTLTDKFGNDIETQDEELRAWINRDAKEQLKIDTTNGTMEHPTPTARGQYFRSFDRTPVATLCRAGVTDRAERLLCGTAYSNYADRHLSLSGEAEIITSFGVRTDRNEPGMYLITREKQYLLEDTSDIMMVQFEADNYEGIKYETV